MTTSPILEQTLLHLRNERERLDQAIATIEALVRVGSTPVELTICRGPRAWEKGAGATAAPDPAKTSGKPRRPGKLAAREEEIRTMYERGDPLTRIARATKCTDTAIAKLARARGWTRGGAAAAVPVRRVPPGASGRDE